MGCMFSALGKERSMALLVFHAFTGCDQTGKFSGFDVGRIIWYVRRCAFVLTVQII